METVGSGERGALPEVDESGKRESVCGEKGGD